MDARLRKEVMAEIIAVMVAAKANNLDEWKVVAATFPGVPGSVIAEAWWEIENLETEAWWDTMDRTIEGEIIRNALKAS